MRLLAALLALAVGAGAARPEAGREVAHPEARFRMNVPAGWSDSLMGPGEMGEGASGAVFKSSASARIVVVFYAAGNPHFKDAADYLSRQTAPLPVTPVGEKTGPAEPHRLGSLEGRAFLRERKSGRELVVAADAPGGFYAVTCSCEVREWKRAKPRFDRSLASFKTLPAPKAP